MCNIFSILTFCFTYIEVSRIVREKYGAGNHFQLKPYPPDSFPYICTIGHCSRGLKTRWLMKLILGVKLTWCRMS